MKIIFLDFDGVMDTAYYDHVLNKNGLPGFVTDVTPTPLVRRNRGDEIA